MGIVLFGPSVALEEVTGFPVYATILLVGVVCTFYTALVGKNTLLYHKFMYMYKLNAGQTTDAMTYVT